MGENEEEMMGKRRILSCEFFSSVTVKIFIIIRLGRFNKIKKFFIRFHGISSGMVVGLES